MNDGNVNNNKGSNDNDNKTTVMMIMYILKTAVSQPYRLLDPCTHLPLKRNTDSACDYTNGNNNDNDHIGNCEHVNDRIPF